MSAERVVYVDSSAIVKLVVREPESKGLHRALHRRLALATSALARTEVPRAVASQGEVARRSAAVVLRRFEFIRINNRVLDAAAALEPEDIRSLDAIHLASAATLGDSLQRIVTYDDRMSAAAKAMGWTVSAPV